MLSTTTHAHEAETYFNASREFDGLVVQSMQSGKMPRIENKEVSKIIALLSDSERFLNSTTYQIQDLNTLMDICGKATNATMVYIYFDLKNNVNPKSEPRIIALQVAKVMESNTLSFQNELELLQPFVTRCMAKEIPLLNEFITSLPPEQFTETRRAGLQKLRNGIFQIFFGFLQAASNSAYKESYRYKVLQSLAETAPQYSSLLQPNIRMQIKIVAESSQTSAPKAFSELLEGIARAMGETGCTGLCRL